MIAPFSDQKTIVTTKSDIKLNHDNPTVTDENWQGICFNHVFISTF